MPHFSGSADSAADSACHSFVRFRRFRRFRFRFRVPRFLSGSADSADSAQIPRATFFVRFRRFRRFRSDSACHVFVRFRRFRRFRFRFRVPRFCQIPLQIPHSSNIICVTPPAATASVLPPWDGKTYQCARMRCSDFCRKPPSRVRYSSNTGS